MKTRALVRWGAFSACLLAVSVPAIRAASFSADLVENLHGQVRTSAFNYQDNCYRFEREMGGSMLVVIVDAAGVTRVLVPDEKIYLEFQPGQRQAAGYNPLGSAATAPNGFEARNEGTEAAEGFTCRKVVIVSGSQEILRSWFADELGIALRIEPPGGGGGLELKNLKPGPQDAALFAVPDGYKLVQRMPPPLPDWAGQVAAAAQLTPPFEQTLEAGGIVRVLPKAGFKIRVVATNAGPEDCTAVSVSFKDGRPLSDVRGSTFTLAPEQSMTTGSSKSPDQMDELVIRVSKGSMTVKAEFVASP